MKRPLMIWVAILLTLAFALLAAAIAVNNLCFTAACESDNHNDGLFITTFTALAAAYVLFAVGFYRGWAWTRWLFILLHSLITFLIARGIFASWQPTELILTAINLAAILLMFLPSVHAYLRHHPPPAAHVHKRPAALYIATAIAALLVLVPPGMFALLLWIAHDMHETITLHLGEWLFIIFMIFYLFVPIGIYSGHNWARWAFVLAPIALFLLLRQHIDSIITESEAWIYLPSLVATYLLFRPEVSAYIRARRNEKISH